jgi:outer membrane protein assembly factor BamD
MAFVRTPLGRVTLGLILSAGLVQGCAGRKDVIPTGMLEADRYLFERASELLVQRKWIMARQYLMQLIDSYPQSSYRPEAKLGLGDTYFGEGTPESLVLGQNEFKEFLTFYPTNRRADYAQFRLALAHYKQMLSPDRDQTETRDTVAEFAAFVQRYPNSALLAEVKTLLRETKDRLGLADYRVGLFYFRSRWYPGAVDRFKVLLDNDPQYTYRDAVYFYMAESLVKMNLQAAALPYYQKILDEFEKSDYLAGATRAIADLKSGKPAPPPPAKKK